MDREVDFGSAGIPDHLRNPFESRASHDTIVDQYHAFIFELTWKWVEL